MEAEQAASRGFTGHLVGFITIAVPVVGLVAILDVPLYLFRVSLFTQQYLALFWGLVSALAFLIVPAKKGVERGSVPWYDWLLAAASLVVGLYVTIFYPSILMTLGLLDPLRVALGAIAVIVVLESTRRTEGWPLTVIVLCFIAYALFAGYFPGVLQTRSIAWPRLAIQLYLGPDSLFGTPLKMVVLVVFAYILFGQFLARSGGSEFFVGIAKSLMGRRRGGSAKAAVIASMLLGGFSSSAVGNVATIGTVTIPMMKRAGYPPVFAAAVESVSGVGDLLMPPIMGTAAFLIPEFLGVPYGTVALAALVPAILYYLGDFLQIDLRSARLGLEGLPPEDIPSFKRVLLGGWYFLVPIAMLIYAIFVLFWDPAMSALSATVALLVTVAFRKDLRSMLRPRYLITMVQVSCRAMLGITVVVAAAGFIVGVMAYTGLGVSLTVFLTQLSGGNLLLLAILTAVVSIVLGTGMPITASYVLLAVVAPPAMIKLGVVPLLAHLFIYYFAVFSDLTPPVALSVYTASSIAGTPMMPAGWQAIRLAIAGYLVPFIFLYRSGLALIGQPLDIVWTVFNGIMAVIFLAVAIEGYLSRPMSWLARVPLGLAGFSLFAPGWLPNIVGLVVGALVLLLHWQIYRRPKKQWLHEPAKAPVGDS